MCSTALKEEFKVKNFRLSHPNPEAFTTSPFLPPRVFIAYRFLMAVYTVTWSILGVVDRHNTGTKWFIFLTNWSYTILTFHFIVGTLVPALYYHYVIRGKPHECTQSTENLTPHSKSPRMLLLACKVSWVLFTVSYSVAFVVTALFWSVVYKSSNPADNITINAHAVNSVLALTDTLVSGIPVRILHVVYPMLYTCTYALFSVLYWRLGGTNPQGDHYIYAALDYGNHPVKAAVLALLFALAAIPTSQLFLFGLYRFRTWLKINYSLNAHDGEDTSESSA